MSGSRGPDSAARISSILPLLRTDDDASAACQKMNDAQPADHYRQKADEISQLARRSRNTSIRLELLLIAELFERMADSRGKAYRVRPD